MIEITFESLGLILFSAIFLSMLLVPVSVRLAHRIGAIDHPKNRSSHAEPTPRMGGLAMSISLAIACVYYLPFNSFLAAFLSGLLVVVLTGLIDDVADISPRWKFVGQIVAASLFVHLSGTTIDNMGDLVGLGEIHLGWASFVFTVFCIVGCMNAFNLSDGLDGLSGGQAVIAAIFFTCFAWIARNDSLLILAVSLTGVIIGFLRYNSYPARVFMGDCGSLMLGYSLAVLLVSLGNGRSPLPLVALAMVITLPLLDTLLVMARRIRHGQSPFWPDRSHLHHRLLDLGLPHPVVVLVIYFVAIFFGVMSIKIYQRDEWVQFSSLFGAGLSIFILVSILQRSSLHYRSISSAMPISSIRHTKFFNRMSGWVGGGAKYWSVGLLVALLFPAFFGPLTIMSHRDVTGLFVLAAVLLIFSWRLHETNSSIFHGTLYLVIFFIVLLYSLSNAMHPSWMANYLDILALLSFILVVFKLYFSSRSEIFVTSGFEVLMLVVSWFIPFVAVVDLKMLPAAGDAVLRACLFSVPILLAMKILILLHKRHSQWVILPLVGGLAVIGLRNLA